MILRIKHRLDTSPTIMSNFLFLMAAVKKYNLIKEITKVIKMLYIMFLSCSLSLQLYAGIGSSVCDQMFPAKGEINAQDQKIRKQDRPNYSLELMKFLGRITLAPSTLVKIHHLKNERTFSDVKDGKKIAFFNPKETNLTPEEEKAYRHYIKEQKNIRSGLKDLGFRKGLRTAKNHAECLSFITKEPLIEIKLQQLQDLIELNQNVLKKHEDSKTSKQLQDQEKFLLKEKWRIIKGKNFNQIHSIIKSVKPNSVLFVSHSSPEGRLFDYASNIFPVSFFTSIENYVHNLILFNCHSEKVNEFYKMSLVGRSINVYFPKTEKGVSLFLKDATPIIALKSIRKIPLYTLDKASQTESCTFQIGEEIPSHYSLFLNNKYLGALVDRIEFNCDLLRDNNRIEVFSTIKSDSTEKPNLFSLTLNTNIHVPLGEINSKTTNRHIVTKGSFTYTGVYYESY